MSDEAKLAEIREHRERTHKHLLENGESVFGVASSRYVDHVDVLLERIRELERQRDHHKKNEEGLLTQVEELDDWKRWHLEAVERIDELERELSRLSGQV